MASILFRYFYSTDSIWQCTVLHCPCLKISSGMNWEGWKQEERSPGRKQEVLVEGFKERISGSSLFSTEQSGREAMDVWCLWPPPDPSLESGLSFDSTLLAPLLFFCQLPLLFLSCLFFLLPIGPFWLFSQKILEYFSLRDRLFGMTLVLQLGDDGWLAVCAASCHMALVFTSMQLHIFENYTDGGGNIGITLSSVRPSIILSMCPILSGQYLLNASPFWTKLGMVVLVVYFHEAVSCRKIGLLPSGSRRQRGLI